MTIRPVGQADAATLARLHATSWRDAYRGLLRDEYLDSLVEIDRLAVWTGRLENLQPAHYGFIAETGGTAVGFVFLHGAEDAAWGTLLDNLHVVPGFTRQGIGRVLMETAARETVRRHPNDGVYLWVFEANHQARRFYARLGGRDVERAVVEAPGGGARPAWRVAWHRPELLLASRSPE
jgi:GNAT superfamily N-acetyltransferase